jgi:hypothetical protein
MTVLGSARASLDWVLLEFTLVENSIRYSVTRISDIAKAQTNNLIRDRNALKTITLFLKQFGGTVTVTGPYTSMEVGIFQNVVNGYSKTLKLMTNPANSDRLIQAGRELESSLQESRIDISWRA